MSDIAVRVEHLSKKYTIDAARHHHTSIREKIADSVKLLFRRDGGPHGRGETIWALKDVSFEVKHGEVLGIIGRNGAGKSTLLKILSRITKPTAGRAEVYGRVGSLLEVGTGFHSELTGRENIYLSGAILGMKRAEINRKFEGIAAFADIERFVDTPVKHYSSGMYMRLAFAVAAHLEQPILVIDEVLAVGDLAFQKKCLGKVQDVTHGGRTVLFVSHDMGAINTICERTLLLHDGAVVMIGRTRDVVARYLDSSSKLYSPLRYPVTGQGEFRLIGIAVKQDRRTTRVVDCRQGFVVSIEYEVVRVVPNSRLFLIFRNHRGEVVLETSDYDDPTEEALNRRPGRFVSSVAIPGKLLKAGPIYGTIGLDVRGDTVIFASSDAFQLDIVEFGLNALSERHQREGIIAPLLSWEIRSASASNVRRRFDFPPESPFRTTGGPDQATQAGE